MTRLIIRFVRIHIHTDIMRAYPRQVYTQVLLYTYKVVRAI